MSSHVLHITERWEEVKFLHEESHAVDAFGGKEGYYDWRRVNYYLLWKELDVGSAKGFRSPFGIK